jgi:hypothetical protein
VTDRGDVGWDIDPDSDQHEQASQCVRAVRDSATSDEAAGAAADRFIVR